MEQRDCVKESGRTPSGWHAVERSFGPCSDGASQQPSPLADAERLIKADSEHRSLAADQALMLRMVIPFAERALTQLAEGVYQWCKHQGFWPGWEVTHSLAGRVMSKEEIQVKKAEKIALLHSEVSEMLEAVRNGDAANEAEEAADIAIRLLDYCGATGINLAREIEQKMLKNYQRPFKHGKGF